jgi:hypothetical protein
MLVYTLILVPLTLVPVLYGGLGAIYGVGAAALGGWLLLDVIRVMRARDFTAPAWRLYRTSLLYLALLFGVMAADSVLGGGGAAGRAGAGGASRSRCGGGDGAGGRTLDPGVVAGSGCTPWSHERRAPGDTIAGGSFA